MEVRTPSKTSDEDSPGNEAIELNRPVGEFTVEVPSDLTIEEMLEYFEPMRREWMRKHYEKRRAEMNPKRFVL